MEALPQRPKRRRRQSRQVASQALDEQNTDGHSAEANETVSNVLAATPSVDTPIPTLPPSVGPVFTSLTVSASEHATVTAATTTAAAAAASSSVSVGHSSGDTATLTAIQISPSASTETNATKAKKSLPPPPVPRSINQQFEYLDHTADVQLHSWGVQITEAFEQVVMAMFGYMTELHAVDMDPALTRRYSASGHDLLSLLYNFMDEFLYIFCTEDFVCRCVKITSFRREGQFAVEAVGWGENFSLAKHPQGTEVKAITYSNMQIHEDPKTGKCDIYVIIDI